MWSARKARKTLDNLRYAEIENTCYINSLIAGGEGGIRTHGTVTRTTVFETVPFDLSGTSPCAHVACHFLGGNLCRFTNPPTRYLARAPSLSDGIFGECQVQGGEEAGRGWQDDQRTCLLDRLG